MDNDLISRSALLKEIEGIYKRHYEKSCYQFIHDFFKAIFRRINKAPAVDASTLRPTGRWFAYCKGIYGLDYKCSKCGNIADEDNTGHFALLTNYCPNCGAKMEW